MLSRSHLVSCLALLLLAGCMRIGGGGSTVIPPTEAYIAEPVPIRIRFTAVSKSSKKIEKRFTEVRCLYRIGKDNPWSTITMSPDRIEDRAVEFFVELPPTESDTPLMLEYSVLFKFDGYENSHPNQGSTYQIELKKRPPAS